VSIYRDLALPQTLTDVLKARDEAVRHLHEAYACHERADAAANGVLRYGVGCDSKPSNSLEKSIQELDRRMWQRSFTLAGFDDMWDAKAARDFSASLDREAPEFTMANLRATFIDLLPQKDEMFKRGVVRLFRNLSQEYKSNDAFAIGPRMVAANWSSPSYGRGRQISYYHRDTCRDLLRVVYMLTDRPFDPGAALSAVDTAWQSGEYRDAYMRIVPFKNGNAHIYILDEPLRDRINTLIADYYNGAALGERKAA
jgi:hypothetical protein